MEVGRIEIYEGIIAGPGIGERGGGGKESRILDWEKGKDKLNILLASSRAYRIFN